MADNKLALDEAQREAHYEAVKTSVKSEVSSEIAAEADRRNANDAGQINDIAGNMRQKAVSEIVQTDREVERGRALARVSQIVDYVFFVIYGLLTIRLLLELFAARESAGFVKFIKSATGMFYAPFAGLLPNSSRDGFSAVLQIVIAIIVYMILHLAVNGFLRIFAHRKTSI